MFVYRQRYDKRIWWFWPALLICVFLPVIAGNWPLGITLVIVLTAIQFPLLLKKITLLQDRIVFSSLYRRIIYYQNIQQVDFDPALIRLTFNMSDGRNEYRFFRKDELGKGLDDFRKFLRALIAHVHACNGSVQVASQVAAFLDDESAEYNSSFRKDRQHRIPLIQFLAWLFGLAVSVSYEALLNLDHFLHLAITLQVYTENGWAVLAMVLLAVTMLAKVGLWAMLLLLETKRKELVQRLCPLLLTVRIAASVLLCLTIALFSSMENSSAMVFIITKFVSCVAVETLCAFAVLKIKIGRSKADFSPAN